MHPRAVAVLTIAGVTLVSVLGLGVAERMLANKYQLDQELAGQTTFTAREPMDGFGNSFGPNAETVRFDPVTPEKSAYIWERDVQFMITQQAHRIGWGPDIKPQVATNKKGDGTASGTSLPTKKIVVVGDSFVWGQSAEDLSMRWPQVMERMLNSKATNMRFEVTSLGRGASSTMKESEWFTPERLQRLQPDAVIVGFVDNDYMPTYTEKGLCEELGTCSDDGYAPASDCGPRCDLAACLLGERSPTGWVLRTLNPWFPNVTRALLLRHCDPDRINARLGLLKESSVLGNPEQSDVWPRFTAAVNRISDNTPGVAKFVNVTRTRPFPKGSVAPGEDVFREAGFKIIDTSKQYEALADPEGGELVWNINPADPHPSSLITYAYAADATAALLNHFGAIVGERTQTAGNAPLVNNYLPTALQVVENSSSSSRVRHANSREYDYLGVLATVNGSGTPLMTVPCAAMGRPHARVMLDPLLGPTTKVVLRMNTSEAPVVIHPVGYLADGTPVQGESFVLTAGSQRSVSLDGVLTGFLIGGIDSGCGLDKEIRLKKFDLSITKN